MSVEFDNMTKKLNDIRMMDRGNGIYDIRPYVFPCGESGRIKPLLIVTYRTKTAISIDGYKEAIFFIEEDTGAPMVMYKTYLPVYVDHDTFNDLNRIFNKFKDIWDEYLSNRYLEECRKNIKEYNDDQDEEDDNDDDGCLDDDEEDDDDDEYPEDDDEDDNDEDDEDDEYPDEDDDEFEKKDGDEEIHDLVGIITTSDAYKKFASKIDDNIKLTSVVKRVSGFTVFKYMLFFNNDSYITFTIKNYSLRYSWEYSCDYFFLSHRCTTHDYDEFLENVAKIITNWIFRNSYLSKVNYEDVSFESRERAIDAVKNINELLHDTYKDSAQLTDYNTLVFECETGKEKGKWFIVCPSIVHLG